MVVVVDHLWLLADMWLTVAPPLAAAGGFGAVLLTLTHVHQVKVG